MSRTFMRGSSDPLEVTLDKHDDKVLSRFGDALAAQPSAMCGASSRVRPRSRIAGTVAKRSMDAGVLLSANGESPCCAGDVAETIAASFPDKRRSSLTTIAFAYIAASALLTKCNSLPMPRFRQTCGRKCRTPCGGRSAKCGLLNNSQ